MDADTAHLYASYLFYSHIFNGNNVIFPIFETLTPYSVAAYYGTKTPYMTLQFL